LEILKNLKVPTGNILIVQGEKGQLECVSLGDYLISYQRGGVRLCDT